MATTTAAQGSNPGLTQTMQIYYDRVFLTRAMIELRHDFGAQVRPVPMNAGIDLPAPTVMSVIKSWFTVVMLPQMC